MRPVNERQAKRFAEEPELISIRATRALLGDVSDKTVRRLVKAGRIEAVKVGARLCRGSRRSAASPEANDALRRKPLQQIHLQCAVVSRNGEARPWQTQEMIEHQKISESAICFD